MPVPPDSPPEGWNAPRPLPKPSRPNPGISERRPRDPGRVGEGIFSGRPRASRVVWLAVVLVVGLIVAWLSTIEWGSEDEREIRRFGNLECVYNVDTDKVEDCVAVPDENQSVSEPK